MAEPTPAELGSLRDEVLRLARMVGDLQTLAAADAAALNLTRRPCDLADLAAAAADSLARRFEAAGITLDRQLAASPVLGDPHWMHQVITNLLTNALKFTPAGGRVTISTGPSGAEAVLQVTDTGSGIAPATCPASSTGSGGASRPPRSPAAASAWLSPPRWLRPTRRLTARSELGRGTEMTLTLPALEPALPREPPHRHHRRVTVPAERPAWLTAGPQARARTHRVSGRAMERATDENDTACPPRGLAAVAAIVIGGSGVAVGAAVTESSASGTTATATPGPPRLRARYAGPGTAMRAWSGRCCPRWC